jgi:ribosomal-protein-alanine N-acetyltransferase
MEEKDLPFVMRIERLCFSHPWRESSFKGEINNHQISHPYVIVHRPVEKVIGYVIFWLLAEEAQISNIAVHPDFRRRGVGETVLKQTLEIILRFGAKYVVLEVRPSNFFARLLYRKFGFETLGIREDYYKDPVEDALVLIKHLSDF